MSYGGSAIITSFIAIGLVANVQHAQIHLTEPDHEADTRPSMPASKYAGQQMSDLWPRIEPLLARVEKPARYIGMERGSRPAATRAPAGLPSS